MGSTPGPSCRRCDSTRSPSLRPRSSPPPDSRRPRHTATTEWSPDAAQVGTERQRGVAFPRAASRTLARSKLLRGDLAVWRECATNGEIDEKLELDCASASSHVGTLTLALTGTDSEELSIG